MSYILSHTRLGFCWWDIPAAIILIALIVYFIYKVRKMKEAQRDLEDQLSKLYVDDSVDAEADAPAQGV